MTVGETYALYKEINVYLTDASSDTCGRSLLPCRRHECLRALGVVQCLQQHQQQSAFEFEFILVC